VSWLLAAAGWGVAIVIGGGLSVQRARTAKWKERFERADYDRNFLTEECVKFIERTTKAEDQVMHLQGRLRAYEMAESSRMRGRAN
jgi:ribosomal protein S12 methylthiotransferase accessory factor YcaO